MAAITSLANPRVKQVVRLQRQSRARREAGRFCLETPRELARALDAGFSVAELFLCDERLDADPVARRVADRAAEVAERLDRVSPAVLEKMAYRKQSAGFLALLEARCTPLAELACDDPALIVVCSGLEKPGNLGAILRSMEGAGASALLLDAPWVDLYNPNCVRASTGAVFGVPIVCDEAEALRDWLRERGIVTLAATPEATLSYLQTPLTGPVALLFGAEDEGLNETWRAAADLSAAIPMQGEAVDSLNVSAAAAVLLFEAMQQRRG